MPTLKTKRDKMRQAIQDIIEEAEINWSCSGIQTEHINELELEEWKLDDPDAVINEILGIVADYLNDIL